MVGEFRLRLIYRKQGRLRFLSHLEVVRSLERGIRRAQLPYAITQGFTPRMRVAFGPALPVGTAAESEYLDVWLTRYTEPEHAVSVIAASMPADLSVHGGYYVAPSAPSLTAALTIAVYEVRAGAKEADGQTVETALLSTIAQGDLAVQHKGKTKVFDLRRHVLKDPRVVDRGGELAIELVTRIGPEGSLRPDVLVATALERSGCTVPVLRTTRLALYAESEDGSWSRPA